MQVDPQGYVEGSNFYIPYLNNPIIAVDPLGQVSEAGIPAQVAAWIRAGYSLTTILETFGAYIDAAGVFAIASDIAGGLTWEATWAQIVLTDPDTRAKVLPCGNTTNATDACACWKRLLDKVQAKTAPTKNLTIRNLIG
jgi:hypothetical protein